MSEVQPKIIPYRERFGTLKPRNAAACIMFALNQAKEWQFHRGTAEVAQYHEWDSAWSGGSTRENMSYAEQARKLVMTLVNAAEDERGQLEYVGGGRGNASIRPFQEVISGAIKSLTQHDPRYTFLQGVVESPELYTPSVSFHGGKMHETYPEEFRALTRTQRHFIRSWRNYYIGVPTSGR